jgi:hypothetical protein
MKSRISAGLVVFFTSIPMDATAEDNSLLDKMHPADRSMFLIIKNQISSNNLKINTMGKLCPPCAAVSKSENLGYEKSLQEIRDRYK